MSVLSHRCACGHPDFFHSNVSGECSHGWCETRCRSAQLADEPELLPTFDEGQRLIERVVQPGHVWGVQGLKACGCDRCKELARQAAA